MRRREVTIFVCWSALGIGRAFGQQLDRSVVGVLISGSKDSARRYVQAFEQALNELGLLHMSNLEFVYRYADGEVARLPGLADELARLRPRAIVCGSTSATLAARAAAADTPIVSAVLTDPVLFGLAASHSQPGGNVTGVLNNVETLPEKQFELLLEMVPAAERIGFVVNLSNPSNVLHQATAERAAKRLAFQSTVVKLRTADDLPRAFEELVQARVQIALFLPDAMFLASRRRIAETALTAGLPIVYSLREHVEDGGLMSYGVDLGESWRYAALAQ